VEVEEKRMTKEESRRKSLFRVWEWVFAPALAWLVGANVSFRFACSLAS